MLTPLATPPYYAVIFTSLRMEGDNGYEDAALWMADLAWKQPGYLGLDSARSGTGITVSYWRDTAAIHAWKVQVDHAGIQALGRAQWYSNYTVRVCRVEYEYDF